MPLERPLATPITVRFRRAFSMMQAIHPNRATLAESDTALLKQTRGNALRSPSIGQPRNISPARGVSPHHRAPIQLIAAVMDSHPDTPRALKS
jgi:hypothetical protein